MHMHGLKTVKKKPFIVFGKPDIGLQEEDAVLEVMRSGWIGTGKVSRQFEEEFSKYMGGGYAVAVSSASIGLVLALRSIGICHGDRVLTTPLTFCATVNSILQVGATPIFCEVDEDGLMDGNKFNGSCDAIVPVNFLGLPAYTNSRKYPVIEDAAHSFGGIAGYGDITVYSFYATKNITSGEGGMIWTTNKELADKCRLLSNQGQSNGAWSRYSSGPIENYQIVHPGYKGNMPDILAAIGLTQLKRWPELEKKRRKVWDIYEQSFGKKGEGHSRHLYTLRVKERAKFREALYNEGIGTGIHYESLHLQPAYRFLGYKKGDFKMAEKIGAETLSLPISPTMTENDADRVVEEVKKLKRLVVS